MRHLSSSRVFIAPSLFRHVLQCGLRGCYKFAGRNDRRQAAAQKLRGHWAKEHSKEKQAFCFIDIGVQRGEQEDQEPMVGKIKQEPDQEPLAAAPDKPCRSRSRNSQDPAPTSASTATSTSTPKSASTATSASTPAPRGPFLCQYPDCSYSVASVTYFGKHWNLKHPEDPTKASFRDEATGVVFDLFSIFTFVMQCKICSAVRCARDHLTHSMEGIRKHVENTHPDEARERDVTELFRVLQDKDGRRLQQEQEHSNYVMTSFNLLQQGGLPDLPELPKLTGPFTCGTCSKLVELKAVMHHKNKEHPGLEGANSFVLLKGSQRLGLHHFYRCLGLCPDSDCDKILAQNGSFHVLAFNMRRHFMQHHGEVEEGWDFTVLLTKQQEQLVGLGEQKVEVVSKAPMVDEPKKPETSKLIETPKKVDMVKRSSTPRLSCEGLDPASVSLTRKTEGRGVVKVVEGEEDCNTSFSNKGYRGPYYCLRLGCSYSCDTFGQSTQKMLVIHWASEHGSVRNMLYLDRSTNSVLNIKVITFIR